MQPVYYAVSIAAGILAVLRYGVLPVIGATRRALTQRRDLADTVHQLVTLVGTLTNRVERLETKEGKAA